MKRNLKFAFINTPQHTVINLSNAFPNATTVTYDTGFAFYEECANREFDLVYSCGPFHGVNCEGLLEQLNSSRAYDNTVIVLDIENPISDHIRNLGLRLNISELFDEDTSDASRLVRCKQLLRKPIYRHSRNTVTKKIAESYRMPAWKRLFDIVFASMALIMLSPLFLVIAVLVRLESKGKIFYYSPRVGTGYHIFPFYKFRSMYTGADAKLAELSHLNQYTKDKEDEEAAKEEQVVSEKRTISDSLKEGMLYMDGQALTPEEYAKVKKEKEASTFIKIKDDPRVTKVGKFIRNTSIDELPQLYNVLIGDMSIVGNRPLPLYEAEKLTTDRFALRFLAPAGITGLWQVSKRGQGEMSEEERMELDNDYAKSSSFFTDISIILRTIPALLQKENV